MKRKIKVILVMVTSLNGKSTKGAFQSPGMWASPEDQEFFKSQLESNNVLVMGRKTYEAARPYMKLVSGKLRIIVTHNPQQFEKEAVDGQLEFTNELPHEIVHRLEEAGYSQVLLLGGSELNSAFFKEKLVDELYLTVEPMIFSSGNGLVGDDDLNVTLYLKDMKKLNTQGTLLLQYQVHY